MAMTLLYAVENALVNLFSSSSLSASVNVYGGVDDETKEAPCIICDAKNAAPNITGYDDVYTVNADIKVKGMAGDMTPIQFDLIADTANAVLLDDNLDLGSYSDDLSVYAINVGSMQQAKSGDAWEALTNVDIVCVNNS